MKISGFTIIKNAVLNDYPIVEAIRSILPLVDEMIVLVGDCEDETKTIIEAIGDPKIIIHDSVWDSSIRSGGHVLAVETNKAFQLIDPKSTWAFYIQADEVVHEKHLESIKAACEQYKNEKAVQGLLFKYVHFYGNYNYLRDSRKWYSHEVRIIRNDKTISSYRDAQGFRKGKTKLDVKKIDAEIYHYGWVKTPQQMDRKLKNVSKYWNADSAEHEQPQQPEDYFDYDSYDSISLFKGTHPAIMRNRIENHPGKIVLDPNKKNLSFKNKILQFVEKISGHRLFVFKNYKILR